MQPVCQLCDRLTTFPGCSPPLAQCHLGSTLKRFSSMKVTKASRDTCLPWRHPASSAWAVISSVEFNREGSPRLSGTPNKRHSRIQPLRFSIPFSSIPFHISTEAAPSVGFGCGIDCQGLESDQSGTEKRARSTPRPWIVQRR
ncbi:unnamed protein product [Pleuronectes platessa]|uniref:Uncharacterized protein n=1 Tax=Pleuronectes platessa TaxID=8262 RepID=A0A9N7UX12_PLEPL|nr:unnamed protein product [Pleuronectes platessa]